MTRVDSFQTGLTRHRADFQKGQSPSEGLAKAPSAGALILPSYPFALRPTDCRSPPWQVRARDQADRDRGLTADDTVVVRLYSLHVTIPTHALQNSLRAHFTLGTVLDQQLTPCGRRDHASRCPPRPAAPRCVVRKSPPTPPSHCAARAPWPVGRSESADPDALTRMRQLRPSSSPRLLRCTALPAVACGVRKCSIPSSAARQPRTARCAQPRPAAPSELNSCGTTRDSRARRPARTAAAALCSLLAGAHATSLRAWQTLRLSASDCRQHVAASSKR